MKNAIVVASVASMIYQFNISDIELLRELGYHVDVVCNYEKGSICSKECVEELKQKLEIIGAECFQVDFARNVTKVLQNLKAYYQLRKIGKKRKYDLIHCHTPIGGFLGRMVFRKYRKSGTKVIYTAHGFHFFTGAPIKNWIVFYPIEKQMSKYTDVLITINDEDYNRAKKKFHAKQVVYLPGVGVDVEKFCIAKKYRNDKREELGLTETDIMLLSVGELNDNKNHELAIKAMAKMKTEKDISNLHYFICGQGILEQYLSNMIQELGLEKNVYLIGYRKDIAEIFGAADIFLFMSKREGLPVSLMEAMASGLPSIVTKVRGNIDLVQNGREGYVVGFDKNEIAQVISTIISNTTERDNLSKNALISIRKRDVKFIQQSMKKIYEQCIN